MQTGDQQAVEVESSDRACWLRNSWAKPFRDSLIRVEGNIPLPLSAFGERSRRSSSNVQLCAAEFATLKDRLFCIIWGAYTKPRAMTLFQSCLDRAGHCCPEQRVLVGFVVDAIERRTLNVLANVQKSNPMHIGDCPVMRAKPA
jgi:hypothetical protein